MKYDGRIFSCYLLDIGAVAPEMGPRNPPEMAHNGLRPDASAADTNYTIVGSAGRVVHWYNAWLEYRIVTILNVPQELSYKKGWGRKGFAHFLEQGIGKTLLTLKEFEDMGPQYECRLMVVIAPNTFKSGWVDEMKVHGYLGKFHPVIFESSNHDNIVKKVATLLKEGKRVVIIINYEAIRLQRVIDWLSTLGENVPNSMIVADESVKLKNYKSLQTKAAVQISNCFEFKRLLSGKPIVQGPHDLWGQFRFLGLLKGVNYFQFRNRYCQMGGYMMKQVLGPRKDTYEELQKFIADNAFLGRKSEYLDLPEQSYTTRKVALAPVLQDMYEKMQADMLVEITEGHISAQMVLTQRLRQHQIAAGFSTNDEGKLVELIEPSKNTRLLWIGDYYEELSGKIMVSTRFNYTLDHLLELYKGLNPAFIRGGMKPDAIDEQKRRFNKDKDCRAMFVNGLAAAYGHTLHADGDCHDMALLEQDENLDIRSQVEQRIHRNGQINACLYCDPYSNPMDKECVLTLQRKESVAALLLNYKTTMWEKNV